MEDILSQERKLSSIDPESVSHFLYGKKYYQDMKNYLNRGISLPFSPNFYNKSRV